MGLFDTHAHYDSGAFEQDRLELIASMPQRGVEGILNPGCDLDSSKKAVELAQTFPFVYAAVGVHPSDAQSYDEATEQALFDLAAHPRVRAVGEIGLDYYWKDNPPPALQKEVFRRQMAMAQALSLPVIVHDREAHQDCLEMVEQFPAVRGVFHCFSGSVEYAKLLVQRGWMLSFTGVITYKNARKAREVLEWLPIERIMLETDAPYMSPEPYRRERNHSGYLGQMAQTLAQIKGMTAQEVTDITTENARRFFNIAQEEGFV